VHVRYACANNERKAEMKRKEDESFVSRKGNTSFNGFISADLSKVGERRRMPSIDYFSITSKERDDSSHGRISRIYFVHK